MEWFAVENGDCEVLSLSQFNTPILSYDIYVGDRGGNRRLVIPKGVFLLYRNALKMRNSFREKEWSG